MRRRVGIGAWLVVLWLLLWGDVSVANLVSGVVVAAVLLVVFPAAPSGGRHVARPLALAHLAAYFAYKLVTSTLLVAREVVSPRSRIRTGIVACPLRVDTDGLVTVVVNLIALSPGTMPVDVHDDPPTLYVHVLLLHDVQQVRDQVARLEELVVRAFGSARAVASPAPGGRVGERAGDQP